MFQRFVGRNIKCVKDLGLSASRLKRLHVLGDISREVGEAVAGIGAPDILDGTGLAEGNVVDHSFQQ